MKELTFNKSSWHARLAYYYGSLSSWQTETDICTYTRAALGGAIKILLTLIGVSIIVLWPLADFLAWIVAGIFGGFVTPNLASQGLMAVVVFLAVTAAGTYAIEELRSKYHSRRIRKMALQEVVPPKPDGFVKNAYKSFKGKYCVRVVVKDDYNEDAETDQ